MKKIFTTILMVLVAMTIWAYDVEVDGIYYNLKTDDKTAQVAGANWEYLTSNHTLVIPESVCYQETNYLVTGICEKAFANSSDLYSITIPNSVKTIGTGAFYWCRYMQSCILPATLTIIEESLFDHCSNLNSVKIPETVTKIGKYAFRGCGIKEVTIPKTVNKIEDYSFSACSMESLTLPNTIFEIGYESFSSCINLKELIIPNSVEKIDYRAFLNYQNLTSVLLSESLDTIKSQTFSDCTKLESIKIPESVNVIENNAFYGCISLNNVSLPTSLNSIGGNAFHDTPWHNSYISNASHIYGNIVYINDVAYQAKSTDITSCEFRDNTVSVAGYAFYNCSGLTTISLPKTISRINEFAFYECTNLQQIHCKNLIPPTCGNGVFRNVKTANCKLYVPVGTKEDYAFATGFGDFVNIIEETVVDPTSEISKPTISYSDNKLQFQCSTPDVTYSYAIKAGDNTTSLLDSETGNVNLSATYTITAYAKKDDKTSESSTATLVWATGILNPESSAKEISVDAQPLLITQNGGMVTISGFADGDTVSAYTVSGSSVAAGKVANKSVTLDLSSLSGQIAVLKVGDKSAKVMVK